MRKNSELLKQDLLESIDGLKKVGTGIADDLRTVSAGARNGLRRFLAPQVANVERLAKDVGATSHDAVARASAAFGAFRASVKGDQRVKATGKSALPRTSAKSER